MTPGGGVTVIVRPGREAVSLTWDWEGDWLAIRAAFVRNGKTDDSAVVFLSKIHLKAECGAGRGLGVARRVHTYKACLHENPSCNNDSASVPLGRLKCCST